ncbi:hypothetical protein [Natrialba sp. PRR66]|nr:hypothetical protein [Natrialba sp. PRR66]
MAAFLSLGSKYVFTHIDDATFGIALAEAGYILLWIFHAIYRGK